MRAASDVFLFFFLCILTFCHCFFLAASTNHPDYSDALAKSILFFQGQRSGKLPHDQKITWRSDSGLEDGQLENVDLTGGYYDAGDNVKFNFPMAFTTTMLSWGALEYGRHLGGELSNVRAAVKWATDYLLKCANASPGKLYVGVGDPNADHKCWERPEDMDTVRTVYSVTAEKPGSDVAGETAAALAAASMVFRRTDRKYAAELVKAAKRVFAFAKDNRGAYSDSLNSAVCPFYCSYSGYQDELLWASAWLFRATKDVSYRNYILSSGGGDLSDIFSWDNKYAGAHVLLSRWTLVEKDGSFGPYKEQAEKFMCAILPKSRSPSSTTQYTQGGLIYKLPEDNLQYVTTTSFLLTTYAKYMKAGSKQSMAAATFNCGGDSASVVTPATLLTLAKQQVDYILGVNPLNMSYMVGFGESFPSKIHHRGSSLPSITKNAQHFSCGVGFDYLATANPNPNILVGAIVGGPNGNDGFANERTNYDQCEPATYINGAIVGPLALLASAFSKH